MMEPLGGKALLEDVCHGLEGSLEFYTQPYFLFSVSLLPVYG